MVPAPTDEGELGARKQALRKEIKDSLKQLSAAFRAESGNRLATLFVTWKGWSTATTLLSFHSLADEIDTTELHRRALMDGKTLGLPRIVGPDLVFHCIADPAALRSTNRFGIREPDDDLPTVKLFSGAGILVVVPGIAFDRSGRRLGRGAGFYDRFLPTLPHATTVGACHDFQLIDVVPAGPSDVRVQWIATDRKIHRALPTR